MKNIADKRAQKKINALLPLGSEGLGAGSVGTSELQEGAVGTSEIADGKVTEAKLASALATKLAGTVMQVVDANGKELGPVLADYGAYMKTASGRIYDQELNRDELDGQDVSFSQLDCKGLPYLGQSTAYVPPWAGIAPDPATGKMSAFIEKQNAPPVNVTVLSEWDVDDMVCDNTSDTDDYYPRRTRQGYFGLRAAVYCQGTLSVP